MTYTQRWIRLWSVVTVGGVGLAMHEWSPLVVIAGLVLDSTCVAVAAILLQTTCREPLETHLEARARRRIARRSLLAVSGVVAASAVAALSPALALLTVLLLVLSSPPVVQHGRAAAARRRIEHGPGSRPATGAQDSTLETPGPSTHTDHREAGDRDHFHL
jgi:hypothetical protein